MVAAEWWERLTLPVIAAGVTARAGDHGATSI